MNNIHPIGINKVRNRDFIRIKRDIKGGKIRVGKIKCIATTVTYKDKDTQHMIIFVPSLDLSGYGSTVEKAKEMLTFEVNEFFKYLMTLTDKGIKTTLSNLGWDQDKYAHKEFSNSYVDIDGNLKNFNVEENSPVNVVQEELV